MSIELKNLYKAFKEADLEAFFCYEGGLEDRDLHPSDIEIRKARASRIYKETWEAFKKQAESEGINPHDYKDK